MPAAKAARSPEGEVLTKALVLGGYTLKNSSQKWRCTPEVAQYSWPGWAGSSKWAQKAEIHVH